MGMVGVIVAALGVPFLGMTDLPWWVWVSFPFAGSMFGVAVLVWSGGKDDESRKKTMWTSVFGLVGATVIPRAWLYVHPAIMSSEFMRDPIILAGMGFGLFLLFSGMASGFMKWREKRGETLGYRQAERWSRDAGFNDEDESKTKPRDPRPDQEQP